MPTNRRSMFNRFRRDKKGAAALEFAIVAAPLIALILAALQTAIIFWFDQALQTATELTARKLMTGSAQSAQMSQDVFHALVCAKAPFPNCTNQLVVDVQSASNFTAISTTPLTMTYTGGVPNKGAYDPGGSGDIVIMRAMYPWPVFGGPLSLNLANQSNGTYLMVATAVFKNEPYQ